MTDRSKLKTKLKKIFIFIVSFLLLISILILVLISCGNKSDDAEESLVGTSGNTEDDISDDTVIPEDMPRFDNEDYNGRTFMIYYINWSLYKDYYFADSINGDYINDAAFNRMQKTNEELNINIQTVTTTSSNDSAEQLANIRKVVMAGDTTYDLLLIHNSSDLATYVKDRLILNWNDVPNIDMKKSYWNQSVTDNMTFAGMTPFASNDFVLPDVNSIFFNTSMLNNLKLEEPYTLVENKLWTWDKITEMASKGSADTNGDGVYNEEDQYGFVGEMGWQFGSIPTSCNQYTVVTGNDGVPVLNINTPKMSAIIEKINTLINSGNNAFVWGYSHATDPNVGGILPISFDNGKALFFLVPLSLAKTFRKTEVDFGILPFPKYDEAQDNYISLNWAGFLCIPASVSDTGLSGKVTELLAYYSKSTVIPAFYDVVLGQKISRSIESTKMLDIIFNNTVYDLGIYIGGGIYSITSDMVKSKSNDFASFYAKNENSWLKTLNDYYIANIEYMAD